MNIDYIVRRRFKYGKRWYTPGEAFVPAGGRFDEGILKSNLVYQKRENFDHPSRVGVRRKGKWHKIGAKASARIDEARSEISEISPPVELQAVEPVPPEAEEIAPVETGESNEVAPKRKGRPRKE